MILVLALAQRRLARAMGFEEEGAKVSVRDQAKGEGKAGDRDQEEWTSAARSGLEQMAR